MVNRTVHPLLRYLRHLRNGHAEEGDLDDAQLLRRFRAARDEAAFTAILQRHGPLVWGVCARRLGETAEAEDAFQATFLVLIRKPPSLHGPHALGPWLYGVAWRTTCKIRRQLVRLAVHERPLQGQLAETTAVESVWTEVRPVIDEEVSRLPLKYRQAVLLCYLQGRSTEEAARLLGCAQGTVFSRLSRGRDLLRQRLTRRGLNVSAGALVAGLAAERTVRAALLESTLHLGLSFAAGTAAQSLSPTLAALVEGALRSMLLGKVKLFVVVFLVLGIAGTGIGFLTHHGGPGQPAPLAAAPVPPAPGKEEQTARPPKAEAGPNQEVQQRLLREQKELARLNELPVQERLRQRVHFRGFEDPKTTLTEALDALGRTYELSFTINQKAFRGANVQEVGKTEIANPPIPDMSVSLKVVLQHVVDRIPMPDNETPLLLLRDGFIEITTKTFVQMEMARDRPLLPLVWENFQQTPIRQALEQVAQSSSYSVVIDPQIDDKVETRMTAQLKNVSTDTAVDLLAAMANVSAVRMDNVFFLTTADKARQLRQQQPQPREKSPRRK